LRQQRGNNQVAATAEQEEGNDEKRIDKNTEDE
jgi:hypothetical protein